MPTTYPLAPPLLFLLLALVVVVAGLLFLVHRRRAALRRLQATVDEEARMREILVGNWRKGADLQVRKPELFLLEGRSSDAADDKTVSAHITC